MCKPSTARGLAGNSLNVKAHALCPKPVLTSSVIFLIALLLIYNVVSISAVQHSDLDVYIYPLSFIFFSIALHGGMLNIAPYAVSPLPANLQTFRDHEHGFIGSVT